MRTTTKRRDRTAELRAALPRLADLHNRFRTRSSKNFFRTFAFWFDESEVTLRRYREIDRDLSFIPATEWEAFAAKVGAVVNFYDKKTRREWEKLFDAFNEALGARVLVENYGCDAVRLVPADPASKTKSPDWFGSAAGKPHYLEVKTLNHSDAERKSWYNEATLEHTCFVPAPLMAKARKSYDEAREQLDAMPGAADAEKVVLFVVDVDHNFDPIDGSVRALLLCAFTAMEDPGYFIQLAVRSVGGD